MLFRTCAALLALFFGGVLAAVAAPADDAVLAKLRQALEKPETGLKIGSVETSELPGLYTVTFDNGPVVYATADGRYFVVGDLFEVTQDGFVNLGEQRRNGERQEMMAAVSSDDMIIFPAQGEKRGAITVFTDISCGYCRKLHREVPELNKLGVEVRYVAYPRGGVGSEGYRALATAWCSDNPNDALTRMKGGEQMTDNVCPGNPVADQYMLGQKAGVRGTPAIILESGEMVPGYQPAADLVVTMGLE